MQENSEMYKWVPQDCPICEVPPSTYLGMRGGAAHRLGLGIACQIWKCGNCGLLFPNPMPMPIHGPEQHYGVPPEEYFQNHDPKDRLEHASMLMQQLKSLGIETGTLLDIGSGRGEVLRVALENGWDATGIETSSRFAEYAAQFSGATIVQQPVEEFGFKDNSFDAVVLGAVLEHLYNPDETIKEIARVLKPGGALFVDVPNELGLYFIMGNLYQKLRRRNWVVNLAPPSRLIMYSDSVRGHFEPFWQNIICDRRFGMCSRSEVCFRGDRGRGVCRTAGGQNCDGLNEE